MKGKVITVHVLEAYEWSRYTAPLTLNLSSGQLHALATLPPGKES